MRQIDQVAVPKSDWFSGRAANWKPDVCGFADAPFAIEVVAACEGRGDGRQDRGYCYEKECSHGDSSGRNVCIAPAAQNGVATIWPISVALLHLPHMAAAKETTLREVGEMLTHVAEHMATKEDVAKLDTRIEDLRVEMIDQFEHADKQFWATHDRLRDIATEITVIHRRVERLEEQGASNAGFAKEIDHLLTRVAEIEKHLGIDKKIAAWRASGVLAFPQGVLGSKSPEPQLPWSVESE
jgi:hypothetical protein